MTERPQFILALTGLRDEAGLVRALGRPGARAGIARRVTDVVELLAVGGAGLGDGVLIAPRFPHFGPEAALRLADHGLACFGVVDDGDDQGEQQLRDWGLPVIRCTSDEDAAAVVDRILEGALPEPRHAGPAGTIIAVTGPVGSVGRTTVAVNLASEVQGRSLLIDADLVAPSIGFHLGVDDASASILGACRMAEQARLTPESLVAMSHSVDPDLHVLTGVPVPERVAELRAAGYEAMWRAAGQCGLPVIVDCGSFPAVPAETGAVRASLLVHAQRVVVVGSPTALGVRRLIDGYGALSAHTAAPVTVVWNGIRPGRSGRAHLARLTEATAALRPAPRVAGLPWDGDAAAACDRRPGALRALAPRSPLRAAITNLGRHVAA